MKKTVLMAALISMMAAGTALADTDTEFRKAVEERGGTVAWNETDRSVSAEIGKTKIQFVVGSNTVVVNGVSENVKTYIKGDKTMMESKFLNNILKDTQNALEVKETKLTLGSVKTYDFGTVKLHAYITNDALYDVSFVIEKGDSLAIIESGAFKANNKEFSDYIASLGKTTAGQLMAYHPNGQGTYGNSKIYATENAVKSWGENGSIKALTNSFVAGFGDVIEEKMPENVEIIKAGDKISIGEIDFNIIEAGDDAYSIEIPEINVIYRHMMGSKCHNIIPSVDFIDAEIANLKGYQQKNYALILTSHYDPEGIEAVAEKISYLEKAKEIAQNSANAEDFTNKMKEAFSDYTGENYLDMTAGMLFN